MKLTPEFLELKFIEAIADNTKIFFGDKVWSLHLFLSGCLSICQLILSPCLQVPNMVLDQRLLGNVLKQVSKQTSTEENLEEK